MNNIYYTYAYCDPRKPGKWITSEFVFNYEPFYIGEGKNNRMFDHLTCKRGNHMKINKIRKIQKEGHKPIILKIKDGLDGTECVALEASLIKQLGTITPIDTIPYGPLTNQRVDFGIKRIMSKDTREKMSKSRTGVALSDEHRAAISAGKLGKKQPPSKRKGLPAKGGGSKGIKKSWNEGIAKDDPKRLAALEKAAKTRASKPPKPKKKNPFKLLTPEGVLVKGDDILKLCEEHSVSLRILDFIKGKAAKYKGWTNLSSYATHVSED